MSAVVRLDNALFSRADSSCDQAAQSVDRQLRHRHHHLHFPDLFALLSVEVALDQSDEEGAEARAANEGIAGKNEGDEADRPTFPRVADGTTALDEGSKSARRLLASADPDAFSNRALYRDHDLD